MIKRNKGKLIVSSLLILFPIVIGLLLWNKLPDLLLSHWGADGTPDGSMKKGIAIFVLPLILLAVHWLCILITAKDKKNAEQNPKIFGIIFWIIPILSLLSNTMMYAFALGYSFNVGSLLFVLLGLLLAIIGNYLPKCKQNFTLGIKIKWTLASEENWNATHRFSGKVWMIGGILLMFCAFLPQAAIVWVLIPAILAIAVIPTVYSYVYYRRQVATGTAPEKPMSTMKHYGVGGVISLCAVILIVALCALLMFVGNITVHCEETALVVEATFYEDLTVNYDRIESVKFREGQHAGQRSFGFSSARLLLGTFTNDEFGTYTRYTYTKPEAEVIIRGTDGKILVLSGKNYDTTKAMYEEISARVSEQ